MKILFISSGGQDGKPKAVVRNQGHSLEKLGVEVIYFCVNGGGLFNYLKSVPALRRTIREIKPDVVHAHYSYSGLLAYLSGARHLIVSFMGSELRSSWLSRIISIIVARYLCTIVIVKSEEMKRILKVKNVEVIPNGVDLEIFKEQDKYECYSKTKLDPAKKNILFVGDPRRREKNYNLALKTFENLDNEKFKLIQVNNLSKEELCLYYNAADLLLMTSLWEGSPNTVKEAMACNMPVVSTKAGDVDLLLNNVKKSFVCSFDPSEIAEKIKLVTKDKERSNGREKIIKMGLDSETVALRILKLYKILSDLS